MIVSGNAGNAGNTSLQIFIIMDENIVQWRINFEKLGNNYPKADDVTIDKETIDSIDCYWFRNKLEKSISKIVIYLHGGCFVLGSIRSHQALVSHLSKELNLPFLFVEYCLAPEKPYPNAINEIVKVYQKLIIQYPECEFIFMGDSAGAGLSVSAISKIYEAGLQQPGYIIMISPWLDLSCSNNSITENAARDPVLKKERLLELASLYISGKDLSNANPIRLLNNKFPPSLILAGSEEILLDDSKIAFEKISQYQNKIRFSIYENQTHVWLLDSIQSEQSQKTITEIKKFLSD